ncbi:DUF6349 family protein [Pseudoclavibacter sp. AY1H1]|uniref:DUF6349 family protein n=1 Tax=Pseudoclavibacter sp. AY1H1 TaxID=2080584 RepID=UPI000CE73F66|nr:DUF6349 family protein [Pseudoclavibacter sp. AY1H1]PPF38356.1 hypothetical protein C5E05_04910 [Pseudoclavibacter sp. AY1H1]
MTSLALFDLADFEAPAPVPATRVPDGFSLGYFPPAELVEAWEQWTDTHGNMNAYAVSRMWHIDLMDSLDATENGHALAAFTAELRWCAHGWHAGCLCVGEIVHRAICEPCSWHAFGSGDDVIAHWHDHAWPGWRDLPVLPDALRPHGGGVGPGAMDKGTAKKARAWLTDAYPPEFQIGGAPMLTHRESPGTRAVPGYSPWGGFDISTTTLAA